METSSLCVKLNKTWSAQSYVTFGTFSLNSFGTAKPPTMALIRKTYKMTNTIQTNVVSYMGLVCACPVCNGSSRRHGQYVDGIGDK